MNIFVETLYINILKNDIRSWLYLIAGMHYLTTICLMTDRVYNGCQRTIKRCLMRQSFLPQHSAESLLTQQRGTLCEEEQSPVVYAASECLKGSACLHNKLASMFTYQPNHITMGNQRIYQEWPIIKWHTSVFYFVWSIIHIDFYSAQLQIQASKQIHDACSVNGDRTCDAYPVFHHVHRFTHLVMW